MQAKGYNTRLHWKGPYLRIILLQHCRVMFRWRMHGPKHLQGHSRTLWKQRGVLQRILHHRDPNQEGWLHAIGVLPGKTRYTSVPDDRDPVRNILLQSRRSLYADGMQSGTCYPHVRNNRDSVWFVVLQI